MSIQSVVQPFNTRVLMSGVAAIVLLSALIVSVSHHTPTLSSGAGAASASCQSHADAMRAADRSRNGVSLTCNASHLAVSGAAQ